MALSIAEDYIVVTQERTAFTFNGLSGWGNGGIINLPSAEFASFGPGWLGLYQDSEVIAFPNPVITALPDIEVPVGSDPPLPPVYPYPVSSGSIYGRENLTANLRMTRGDNFTFVITVRLNGNIVDITGNTFTMTCRWAPSGNVLFTRSTSPGDGITLTDPTRGEATIELVPSNTNSAPLDTNLYDYDIEMVTPASKIYTVLRGKLRIDPDITQA
jgi:hypothetical protein